MGYADTFGINPLGIGPQPQQPQGFGNAAGFGQFLTNAFANSPQAMAQKYAYLGANPYQGGWDALIGQLRQQASGQGPSLAAQQYQQANQTAMANQLAMARAGRSPGAAYNASNNMNALNQGLSAGVAQARTQEQLGSQQALAGALSGAGNADLQRALANQQAYWSMIQQKNAQPSDFEKVMGVGSQLLGMGALMGR